MLLKLAEENDELEEETDEKEFEEFEEFNELENELPEERLPDLLEPEDADIERLEADIDEPIELLFVSSNTTWPRISPSGCVLVCTFT